MVAPFVFSGMLWIEFDCPITDGSILQSNTLNSSVSSGGGLMHYFSLTYASWAVGAAVAHLENDGYRSARV
jgi:hypothetical protein